MSLTPQFGLSQVKFFLTAAILAIAGLALWLKSDKAKSASDPSPGASGRVHVAVASNFLHAHEKLATLFQTQTGSQVITSSGSTGNLYAQIRNGAPYDIFLAADIERPRRLVEEGIGVRDSLFSYAIGRLALYVPNGADRTLGPDWLKQTPFKHLAIANPEIAPYGQAAKETLTGWGMWEALQDSLVRGENIAQTFQFVHSGAAEVGLVAWSQVHSLPENRYWIVPRDLHQGIRQDAVLLQPDEPNQTARGYLDFLKSPAARKIIEHSGYSLPD